MEYKFGGKYLLEEEIANGGCGTVYLGSHHIAGKPVAIKLEAAATHNEPTTHDRNSMRKSKSNPNLPHHKNANKGDKITKVYPGPSPLTLESQIYKRLCGAPGVPFILHSGKAGPYNVLILDLLGPSLDDLFKLCNRAFSLKTVCLLADQLLERIEFIHSRGIVHRDIKPANFVMGRPSGTAPTNSPWKLSGESVVNVIDFGLAKKFRDSKGLHIPYNQQDIHGVGTSLFAAINTHMGIESSRRDDLESLAYMLIYFMRGTLPWRKIRAPSRKPEGWKESDGEYNPITMTWNLIRDAKLKAEPTLCNNLPPEMDVLFRYARSLSFDDLPDYSGLRELFRGLASRAGVKYPEDYDGIFDWTVPPPSSHSHSNASALDLASAHRETGGRTCEACRMKKAGNIQRKRWT